MFLGINMFLALLRAHFKMILSRAKNIFMPANVNSIVILLDEAERDIRIYPDRGLTEVWPDKS